MNPFASTSVSDIIASSTTSYLGNFAPIFEWMAGLILAMALITWLVGLFAHRGREPLDLDDAIMDL